MNSPNAAIIVAFFCGAVALFVVGLILQRVRYSRKQRESRMSEERYLQALEGSTDGLWDWDLTSDSIRYSDGFMKILGVSSQEFPGDMASLRSRLHPEDTDAMRSAIENHLKEHAPFFIESRLQTKSGTYLWFLTRGQAVWDAAGKAVRMSGWIQNIDERKQAELNLKAALSEIKHDAVRLPEQLRAFRPRFVGRNDRQLDPGMTSQ